MALLSCLFAGQALQTILNPTSSMGFCALANFVYDAHQARRNAAEETT
jgi:hypothetical protein